MWASALIGIKSEVDASDQIRCRQTVRRENVILGEFDSDIFWHSMIIEVLCSCWHVGKAQGVNLKSIVVSVFVFIFVELDKF